MSWFFHTQSNVPRFTEGLKYSRSQGRRQRVRTIQTLFSIIMPLTIHQYSNHFILRINVSKHDCAYSSICKLHSLLSKCKKHVKGLWVMAAPKHG